MQGTLSGALPVVADGVEGMSSVSDFATDATQDEEDDRVWMDGTHSRGPLDDEIRYFCSFGWLFADRYLVSQQRKSRTELILLRNMTCFGAFEEPLSLRGMMTVRSHRLSC